MTVNDIMIVTFRYEHYATDVAGCTYLWDNTIWRSLLSGWLYSIRGGSRHGCGMRLTPHPPLAPKPFDHGLNEWIALSMGWWAQPPPPPSLPVRSWNCHRVYLEGSTHLLPLDMFRHTYRAAERTAWSLKYSNNCHCVFIRKVLYARISPASPSPELKVRVMGNSAPCVLES